MVAIDIASRPGQTANQTQSHGVQKPAGIETGTGKFLQTVAWETEQEYFRQWEQFRGLSISARFSRAVRVTFKLILAAALG
jgi:hypothetical protein